MINGSGLSRRGFLRGAGAAVLGLSLGRLSLEPAKAVAAPAAEPAAGGPDYRSWEDIYRKRWTWDSVAKGSHYVNCWYQGHCNWNVYVKDGVVFREEQVATYPQTNPDVPDFNPRGCQKGACFSERMYDPGRVRHPLKRVELAGGQYHLHPMVIALQPSHTDRDTRVEVQPL